MLPDHVDEALKSYREYVGRCGHLECEIEYRKMLIERLKQTIVEDSVSCTQTISDMPRGGKLSDPTAKLGSALADGYETDEIKALRKEIVVLERELMEKNITVHFVTEWLKCLNEKERLIIEKQVIDGAFWRDVVRCFQSKFGEEYSKDGLKWIKRRALDKIYKIAQ